MTHSREWIFLRLLLNAFFSAKQDVIATLMPQDMYEQINSITYPQKDPKLALSFCQNWSKCIHISWLNDVLNTFPDPLKKCMQDLLSQDEEKKKHYSEAIQKFLCTYLYRHTKEQDIHILPKELLQETPLSPLLEVSRHTMLNIVDLLALHDLAEEVRYIVDKKLLQGIIQFLNDDQQKYLRILLRQKTKVHIPQTHFQKLIQDKKKFIHALHKKGLQRFACALSGQEQDFLWYILHALDVARARYIQTLIHSEAVPNTTYMIQLQIIQILQFLNSGSQS